MIEFDTTNKTFAEDDANGYEDHGTYSLGQHVLNMLWTGGKEKGITFQGTYNSSMDEFIGTFKLPGHGTNKGDLIAIK